MLASGICTKQLKNLRRKGLREDTFDDKTHPGRSEISKIFKIQPQLQRVAKPRASVEHSPPQVIKDKEEITFDRLADAERNPPQLLPDDGEISSDEQIGDD